MAHPLTLAPSEVVQVIDATAGGAHCVAVEASWPTAAVVDRRSRGMITIEYAIGVVMVIALVGAIVLAIQSGQADFGRFVKAFIDFLIQQIPAMVHK